MNIIVTLVASFLLLVASTTQAEVRQLTTYSAQFGVCILCDHYKRTSELVTWELVETDETGQQIIEPHLASRLSKSDKPVYFKWSEMPPTQFRVRRGVTPIDEEGLPTGERPNAWAYSVTHEGCDHVEPGIYRRIAVPEPNPLLMLVSGILLICIIYATISKQE